MLSEIFGVPIYLAIAIACLVVVVSFGLIRGGGEAGADRSVTSPLQAIAAVAGLASFAMQILQWLKLI